MGTAGEGSTSEASSFSARDRDDLASVARSLPSSWCATVEWNGQLAITPVRGHRFSYGDWAASPEGRLGRVFYSSRYAFRPKAA